MLTYIEGRCGSGKTTFAQKQAPNAYYINFSEENHPLEKLEDAVKNKNAAIIVDDVSFSHAINQKITHIILQSIHDIDWVLVGHKQNIPGILNRYIKDYWRMTTAGQAERVLQ